MSTRYDDILAAIKTALGQIRTENGYRTDAGATVLQGEEYRTAEKARPFVLFFTGEVSDTLEGDTPPSQGEENHFMALEVEGEIEDTESGANGNKLRQDILQALKKNQFLDGLTEGYSGAITSNVETESAGKDGFISFVRVSATVFFVTTYVEEGYGALLSPASPSVEFFRVKEG